MLGWKKNNHLGSLPEHIISRSFGSEVISVKKSNHPPQIGYGRQERIIIHMDGFMVKLRLTNHLIATNNKVANV